jgi:DNA-binding CsgD family transcriptional regulator
MASIDPVVGSRTAGLARLVSAIGDQDFGNQLLAFFQGLCGVEHCTVFNLDSDAARGVATAGLYGAEVANRQIALYLQNQRWQRDPMIAQARKQLEVQTAGIVQTAVRELPDADFRDILYGGTNICDRVLLCGRSATGIVGLSLLRTSKTGDFSSDDIFHVHEACAVLMAIVNKHIALTWQIPDLPRALTSLGQIEACLAGNLVPLSRRETEVCARILHGVSSLGIALDLGISEETVMTYRKRAYQRLGIGSQRELLLWYLELWSSLNLRRHH